MHKHSQTTCFVVLCSLTLLSCDIYADGPPQLSKVETIELKEQPGTLDHLYVDSASGRLFLANQSNNTLDIIDVRQSRLMKQVPQQNTIHGVVYVPSLHRIFTGNGEGVCNVLDGKPYEQIKSIPVPGADSVRFDPRTQRVLVASTNSLTIIDAKSHEVMSTIKLAGSSHAFQVAKAGNRAFVNAGPPVQVAVIDTDKNEVATTYGLSNDSKGIGPMALDEEHQRIFVGLRNQPRLAILDINTGKELATAPIPEGADDLFYDPQLKAIFVTCSSGFIAVIKVTKENQCESVTQLATVKGAKTSFYDPLTSRLYVGVPKQQGKDGPEIWVYQVFR